MFQRRIKKTGEDNMTEVFDLRETTKNRNPLVRLFFKWKFKRAIKLNELKKGDIILDYGCGGKYIENYINNNFNDKYIIYSYDINPNLTGVKDYRKYGIDKVFVIDVFEHMTKNEIEGFLYNLKKLNNKFDLVMVIPYETKLWRFLRKMMGMSESVDEHVLTYKEIFNILDTELKLIHEELFLGLSFICKYHWEEKYEI
jgi:hypothetical protein